MERLNYINILKCYFVEGHSLVHTGVSTKQRCIRGGLWFQIHNSIETVILHEEAEFSRETKWRHRLQTGEQ